MRLAAIGAITLTFLANAASAQVNLGQSTAGYNYFNRPGADLATHDRELLDCVGRAAKVFANTTLGNFRGFGIENCMVVKGWRVARVGADQGQALSKSPWSEVSSGFLAVRVGAADPPPMGIARTWANDAARPSTIRNSLSPNYDGKPSISLAGLDPARIEEVIHANPPPSTIYELAPRSGALAREVSPKALAALPADTAIILVRIKNPSARNGVGLSFERDLGDPPVAAWAVDGRPSMFTVSQATLGARKEGRMAAIPVPPGRWRISSLVVGGTIDFCLGSPSFEVKAGETVFAGTFDMGADPLAPEMDMADARASLSGRPDSANRMRPADYRNGATGPCRVGAIYALEFEGAPFAEGYEYGGAAKAASTP